MSQNLLGNGVEAGGGGGITQLTGDVTAGPGTGSQAATIAAGAVDASMTSITGTPDGSKYLRDDWSWQTVAGSGAGEALAKYNFAAGSI